MRKYFCDICGVELGPDYGRSEQTVCPAAKICGALDLCPSCTYIGSELDAARVLGQEWRRLAGEKSERMETPGFRGRGGEEKREIFRRLGLYRQQHGLGELAKRAGKMKITEAALRGMLQGEKFPLETWRTVGALLKDVREEEDG